MSQSPATEAEFYGADGTLYTLRVRTYDLSGQPDPYWVTSQQISVSAETSYYRFDGQVVAMSRGEEIAYLAQDQLGSTSLVVSSSGEVLSEVRYYPYGEIRSGVTELATDKTFTGQRAEDFGLLDYNARFYDPRLGRFASADTMIPDPGNPLDWDRYGYVRNNPINYSDPSGHRAECGLTADDHCGAGSGPIQPTPIIQAPEDALDNVWAGAELVASVLFEPADWVITGAHCLQGDCSPYVLLGLLPLLPSSACKHVDDLIQTIPTSTSGFTPDFIGTSSGDLIIVPSGAKGPAPARSGKGVLYKSGSGGHGLAPNVSGVRIMDPTLPKLPSPGYLGGYASYYNQYGQTVNPYTGLPIPRDDPWWHIPLNEDN